jgi:hypothetical protein
MPRHDVRQWFIDHEVVGDEDIPSGEQLELLTELSSLYTQRGLLAEDGSQPPLWRCCTNRSSCWRDNVDCRPPEADGRSGISLPYIGPSYRPGGVVVVGLNLRDAGGLLEEYAITCSFPGEPSQLNELVRGRRKIHGSTFGYRTTRSAAAVLDAIDGDPVEDHENPVDLAPILKRIARLQYVKCSPDDGDRSSPTDAMTKNCPPLLLLDELSILRPTAILTFGDAFFDGLEMLPGHRWENGTDWLAWGTITIGQHEAEVFSLYHPAAARGYWQYGQDDLVEMLRNRQTRHPRAT